MWLGERGGLGEVGRWTEGSHSWGLGGGQGEKPRAIGSKCQAALGR